MIGGKGQRPAEAPGTRALVKALGHQAEWGGRRFMGAEGTAGLGVGGGVYEETRRDWGKRERGLLKTLASA